MEREQVLAAVEAAFAARMAGDVEAMASFWAEGATFRFAGEESLMRAYPGSREAESGPASVETIMALVAMTARETVQAVIDGNTCALVSRASVSFGGREPFETLLLDLFELDEAGKITSVLEFADSAKLTHEMAALGM